MHGDLIKLLSIAIIFTGIANVIRTQYLIPREKDKEYIISVFMGAIINLIMNYIFIPIFDAKGAVFGTVCAEALVCIIQIIFLEDKSVLYKNFKQIIKFIISSLIMYLLIDLLGKYISNGILNIAIRVTVGIIIYIGINYKLMLTIIRRRKDKDEVEIIST